MKRIATGLAAALVCASFDCPTSAKAAPAETTASAEGSLETYALGAGDKLRIAVFNVAAITGAHLVGSSGVVSLPLVGEMMAAGKTTATLAEAIRVRLAEGYVNDPKVSVEVMDYRPYYILGEVNKPGSSRSRPTSRWSKPWPRQAGIPTVRRGRRPTFVTPGGREQLVRYRDLSIYVLPGDTIRIGERYL
jgi:polysaccharide export outer membrane protein